ncbi:MAG: polyprenyl synthetase family protein, partial [Terriglobales bacterium]
GGALAGMLAAFAAAAGTPEGMLSGQAADIAATAAAGSGATTPLETVTAIHRRKTAALIRTCLTLGGTAGRARPEQMQALELAGADLGLAFQIMDDVLDVTSDSATLGKSAGKDAAQKKLTYPALVGISASLQQAQILAGAALDRLDAAFPTAAPLYQLSELLVRRSR